MDNTLDALRNLYVALGGNEEDVAGLVITPDFINAIAGQMAESGTLKPFIIEVTKTEDEGTYSVDKSYEEIEQAYEKGSRLVLKMTINDTTGYAELQGKEGSSFAFVADDFVSHLHYVVAIAAGDTVIVSAYVLTPATE